MLNIFDLQGVKKEALTSKFFKIATEMMHNHVLVVNKGDNDKKYQIVEIEFYFSSEHDEIDLFRHDQKNNIIANGLLRFHYSGIDISLKQEIDKKLYYGGILIRAIKGDELTNGPLSVVKKLFSEMSLTEPFSIALKPITPIKNADKILSSYRVNLNPFPQENLKEAIQHRFLPWRFIADKKVGNLHLTHGIEDNDYKYNANPYQVNIEAGKEPINKNNLAGYFELFGYYQNTLK